MLWGLVSALALSTVFFAEMFSLSQPALLALQQQQQPAPSFQPITGFSGHVYNTPQEFMALSPRDRLHEVWRPQLGSSLDIGPFHIPEKAGLAALAVITGGALAGAGGAAAGESGAGASGAAGGAGAGGTTGVLDTSGFGSSFDAAGMGGTQYDMTGFGSAFDAGAFGGKQYDMTGFGSPFDSAGMTTANAYSMPNTVTPPDQKTMSPLDKARLALQALPSGGGMLGGGYPQQMAPASLFTPVMPGALYPFGR